MLLIHWYSSTKACLVRGFYQIMWARRCQLWSLISKLSKCLSLLACVSQYSSWRDDCRSITVSQYLDDIAIGSFSSGMTFKIWQDLRELINVCKLSEVKENPEPFITNANFFYRFFQISSKVKHCICRFHNCQCISWVVFLCCRIVTQLRFVTMVWIVIFNWTTPIWLLFTVACTK